MSSHTSDSFYVNGEDGRQLLVIEKTDSATGKTLYVLEDGSPVKKLDEDRLELSATGELILRL